MAENIKQIAVRIRTLREISGESAAKLAGLFNITQEEYLNFESGQTDIPVSFLYEIASHYKVELTALLTGGEPHRKAVSLARAQAREYSAGADISTGTWRLISPRKKWKSLRL